MTSSNYLCLLVLTYVKKMIKIKVDRAEFEAAESNGYAYGRDLNKRSGKSPWSVVIILGEEKPYPYSERDPESIEYKFFLNCEIRYAENDAKVDEGDFAYCVNKNVAIYY
jgi:hypothetical protein